MYESEEENKAFLEGLEAFNLKQKRSENPYTHTKLNQRMAWFDGWDDHEDDIEDLYN